VSTSKSIAAEIRRFTVDFFMAKVQEYVLDFCTVEIYKCRTVNQTTATFRRKKKDVGYAHLLLFFFLNRISHHFHRTV
jgi:hypothetical protein